ncbi:hypothetical protein GETHLI_00180 [Geothrix limicola]|uniref:DUF2062 domain-containing protein n=1 Tax=Geothrix limicola TaxID=2927978 RepID=A0ABQ5QAY5_9BACT|nr:DUF2062 domain-containing protein [Geothrix limicola]GLH71516.1 hypothetical protein GETHLI_00180 [Geothrix limicola]
MSWVRTKIREPLLGLLKQGLSPAGLAWSLAVGLALGTIPLFGTSTLLCVGVGLVFRLNQPALQLANYLAYPLQLLLFIPLIRLGERLFRVEAMPLSPSLLMQSLEAHPWSTLTLFWSRLWHASVVWALLALPAATLLALLLRPVFAALARRLGRETA